MTVVNIDRSVDDVVIDIAHQDWNQIPVPSLLGVSLHRGSFFIRPY